MTNAYDLKELGILIVSESKKEGLALAETGIEKLAKAVYLATKQWAKDSSVISENKIDDLVSPFYDQVDRFVLPQIEKIDFDGSGD